MHGDQWLSCGGDQSRLATSRKSDDTNSLRINIQLGRLGSHRDNCLLQILSRAFDGIRMLIGRRAIGELKADDPQ